MARLFVVWMVFVGFGVAEARGIRPVADRLSQVVKRGGIGKLVSMTALGAMLLCSPGCEYGERMVSNGFVASDNPANLPDSETFSETNLPYTLGDLQSNLENHTGIDLSLIYYTNLGYVTVSLQRPDTEKGKTFREQFHISPRTTSENQFDIYTTAPSGGDKIGSGSIDSNGQTSYNFNTANGVTIAFAVGPSVSGIKEGAVASRALGSLRAHKEVASYDDDGNYFTSLEQFSWLGLPATHYLWIGSQDEQTYLHR